MTQGLFIGRFQPFHLGHLKDVKEALEEVDELVIGIGSSQEKDTEENPFSVEERIEMIEFVLAAEDIGNYTIFPIPDFNDDKKWLEHVETLLPEFDIVYTGNDWTERCFKEKYKVKKIKLIENISSTIIRDKILKNENWQDIVPKKTVEFLEKINGVERIKNN
jgi:nicotinamide-nucleotide adenylyltransferase